MSNKGKKKVYECLWYRYDFDDFVKHNICEHNDCGIECPYKGLLERQKCSYFQKNKDNSTYLKVDDRFNEKCDAIRKHNSKLEQIKYMCERQKAALDDIIEIVEEEMKNSLQNLKI